MAFRGIDIRESGDRVVFRAKLYDADVAILPTGTTNLTIYEQQSDGSLLSYDFADNTFKAGALTTEVQAMTHRTGNNGTTNTGLWTYALTTLTGFTAGNVYYATVSNSGAAPVEQTREFQFGSGVLTDNAAIDTQLSGVHGAGSWASAGSGNGAQVVTVRVSDADALRVEGVSVGIRDSVGDALGISGTTDTDGEVVFALDNATYQAILSKSRFVATVPEALVVSGDGTHAYTITAISPTEPAPGTQTLYAYVGKLSGAAGEGDTIRASVYSTPQDVDGVVLDSQVLTDTADSAGYVELAVIQGAVIRVVIETAAGDVFYERRITITTDATKDLTDY